MVADPLVELFFHTDRSGWDNPPELLITTLKVKSDTGGEAIVVDGFDVIAAVKTRHPKLYSLLTNSKYSSFKDDSGKYVPRPIFDVESGILRFRYDDSIQLSASLVEAFPIFRSMIYEFAYPIALEPGQCYIVDNHRFLHGRTSFTGSRELLRALVRSEPLKPTEKVVKPILFDIDGTLCRSESLSIDAYYRCVSDVVRKEITNENTKVNLHGQTDLSLLQDILQHHGVRDENKLQSLVQQFFQLHPQYLKDSLAKGYRSEVCPGANSMLEWVTTQKDEQHDAQTITPIGLLTGNSKANALLKISAAGIDPNMFDWEISAFGDKCSNREELVRNAAKKTETQFGRDVDTKDITLVGDTPLDIKCAKSTGCGVVAVATGNYSSEQLAPLEPDLLCESLPEAKPYFSAVFSGEKNVSAQ